MKHFVVNAMDMYMMRDWYNQSGLLCRTLNS